MIHTPRTELQRLAALLAGSVVVGLLLGVLPWALILALSFYIGWNLRQLFRLYNWLKLKNPVDPPDSRGLWGSVFDDIFRLQRHQFKYRRRLKKVIKRFRDSTYALRDGFVMLNKRGVIEWWNPTATRILGLRPEDRGQPITHLIRQPAFKTYFFSGEHDSPLEGRSPINNDIELMYQLAYYGKDEVLLIIRDITELKRLERIRTDFVANVSHELRTPVTVIDGYLETLTDNTDIMHPRWQQAMEHMSHQTKRMKSLIQDLLLLSRLESRSNIQNHKSIDMTALMQNISADLQPILQPRQQQLEIEGSCATELTGHYEEIYSLLSNLIINASKYSPHDTCITLKWEQKGEHGELSVSDQGIGIADTDLPRLTERFYRVDKGRSQNVAGTGLGLAIVKHILINHDATLQIESTPSKGSCFTCHFPKSRLVAKKDEKNSEKKTETTKDEPASDDFNDQRLEGT